MKNKLTLEHLAPYLPYELKTVNFSVGRLLDKPLISKMIPSNILCFVDGSTESKILLRPLSDLTKEIEVNGVKFVPKDELDKVWTTWSYGNIKNLTPEKLRDAPYWFMEQLFRWNFDTLGLIEKNLAININTLK